MRVGLVSREYPPFVGGGIGSYASRLAREMAARGHQVFVVTVSDDGREHCEQRDGVDVIRLPFVRGDDWSRPDPSIDDPLVHAAYSNLCPTAALSLIIRNRLPALLEQFEPDVLEFPDTGALGWFTLNARLTEGLRTPPIVVCAHSPSVWVKEHNRDPGLDRISLALEEMESDCFHWADGLVCPSRALAGRVERDFGVDRVEAIPLPIGELSAMEAHEPPRGTMRLLFVGRLEPRKGIDILLAALTEALGQGVDLHLDLAGADTVDPRTREAFGAAAIKRLVPRSFRSCVTHHDQLGPEALAALRAKASVAVVPSPDDNFPYTCVEAMASGLAVLATRAGGMAEMIRDGVDGQLWAPTVKAWAEALVSVARADPFYLKMMGDSARSRINAMCANDDIVARRIEHFARCATEDRPDRDTPVVTINAGDTSADALARLTRAAQRVGGFGIGWPRGAAAPSPSARWMAMVDDGVGAVCIERAIIDRLRPTLPDLEGEDRMRCEHAPDLVRALLRAQVPGVVVPGAAVDADTGSRSGMALVPRDSIPAAALLRARRARGSRDERSPRRVLGALKRALRGKNDS